MGFDNIVDNLLITFPAGDPVWMILWKVCAERVENCVGSSARHSSAKKRRTLLYADEKKAPGGAAQDIVGSGRTFRQGKTRPFRGYEALHGFARYIRSLLADAFRWIFCLCFKIFVRKEFLAGSQAAILLL